MGVIADKSRPGMFAAVREAITGGTTRLVASNFGRLDMDVHLFLAGYWRWRQRNLLLQAGASINKLRLNDAAVALDPNDSVLGVDFSGGMSSVVSQLNAAFGTTATLQFSNPSGSTLRVLDDGAVNRSDVTAVSVTKTMMSLTSGYLQLPLFSDNGAPYSGAITATGLQQSVWRGASASIPRCSAIPRAPSSIRPIHSLLSGDTARSDFIFTQLSKGYYRYSPQTGIGTTGVPFTGTLTNFAKQFISQRARPRPPPSGWRMARTSS